MATVPETAPDTVGLRRVVIDPVTRVEGHGKVTLLLDDANRVRQARLHIVEFRGFEKFIQGRPYWEIPVLVQRLCGICPVSHHLAAAKAIDQLVGVDVLTPTAEKLRRLLHLGQILQSHALHFFHLASPDLLFGFGSDALKRNIVGVAEADPKLALKGIGLLEETLEKVQLRINPSISIKGILPTMVSRSLHHREVLERVIESFGDLVFHTTIPDTIKMSDATMAAQPITVYASSSPAAAAYRKVAAELIQRIEATA